jgi:anti-sigma factor RsiW
MTCRELVELVTDYLEGALAPAVRTRFDAHVERCTGCAAYIDQMRRTIALVGRLSEDDLAPAIRDALLAAFRDWRRETPAF